MNCAEFQDARQRFPDRTTVAERSAMLGHLHDCERCREDVRAEAEREIEKMGLVATVLSMIKMGVLYASDCADAEFGRKA